jgi:hypothetical protein
VKDDGAVVAIGGWLHTNSTQLSSPSHPPPPVQSQPSAPTAHVMVGDGVGAIHSFPKEQERFGSQPRPGVQGQPVEPTGHGVAEGLTVEAVGDELGGTEY